MSVIRMSLLQTPQITHDDAPITLPFRKAEGLLYYLAVKKTISREQAAALLWSSNDEATAKKNLRHALYTIKKIFQTEVVISPQKQLLTLNPEITFIIDYEEFLSQKKYELYNGDFLQGFYIKSADEFEEWLGMERISARDAYLRMLYEHMLQLDQQNVTEAEICFRRYLKEDALDERIYYSMMQIYQENKLYHKGIKVYESLSSLLNTELRISPGKKTASLYRELLNAWTEETTEDTFPEVLDITGREQEVLLLAQYYHAFLAGRPTSILVSGENGIGKTHLVSHFLDSLKEDNCLILRSFCFLQDSSFPYESWNNIIMQLDKYISSRNTELPRRYLHSLSCLFPMLGTSDPMTHIPEDVEISYNYRAVRNSIIKLLTLIGAEIPIIIFFDNIHDMDICSLELLTSLIAERSPNIMFLCTHLDILKP